MAHRVPIRVPVQPRREIQILVTRDVRQMVEEGIGGSATVDGITGETGLVDIVPEYGDAPVPSDAEDSRRHRRRMVDAFDTILRASAQPEHGRSQQAQQQPDCDRLPHRSPPWLRHPSVAARVRASGPCVGGGFANAAFVPPRDLAPSALVDLAFRDVNSRGP